MAADAYHLAVTGLRKSFGGVEVLHGVDLEARGGRVLALLGENGAGKSTTVKILAGDYSRDAGEITLNGRHLDLRTPRDAERAGIRVIFQEFLDAPDLSVAENICLGRLPRRGPFVDWRRTRRQAQAVLEQLGVDLPVDVPVERLGVAQRQIVEIARALATDARLLILDEPTSALASDEVDRLFHFIRRLRDHGVAIIYITHRLHEVAEIADDVLVFRDGDVVASGPASDFDESALVEAMVGHRLESTIDNLQREHAHQPDEAGAPASSAGRRHAAATADGAESRRGTLEVRGASLAGHFTDVTLSAYPGEVLSLFGRLGCGALEFAEAMFGLRRLDAGEVVVDGVPGQPRGPWAAIQRGIGFLPTDRKTEGLLTGLSVSENLTVADWSRKATWGILRPSQSADAFERWQGELNVSAPQGPRQPIETLSGGNQQKVMLGRWLERGASLLLLAEPTRGVDVGARAEIYRVLARLAERGIAVVVVSSDIEEVLRISDRIVVFSRGRIADVLARDEIDRARLTRAAAMRESA